MQRSLILLILMAQSWSITGQLYEYKYVTKQMSWEEARLHCIQHHTDLATVTNMTDMMRLREAANNVQEKKAWIGLQQPKESNRKWHWSLPGLEFNETNWGSGESGTKNEYCGAINEDLTWVDHGCGTPKPFICYNERDTSERFYFIEDKKTWFEAQRFCRSNHTDLVSGLQQLRDKVLRGIVESQDFQPFQFVFIGLFSDAWEWSDGSSFSFRDWDMDKSGGGNKYAMLTQTGMERTPSSGKKPFFCYEDHVILINESRTWEEALYYCRHHHHDLVTITNLDDQRWVQEKTKDATTPYVWTGLRYTCTLGFWFWVSDEVVRYKNWASPEQVNKCDMSGAMETGGEHKWVKKHDEEKFNFFCSK
ncbi:Macrophage mannose receptor 1 [Oryzias melastigma]|uniref:Macrophage mannose receptor 1 n=1 Tax=Oryzias melastigma TaxID=30732 RepID=A0A834BSE2_ORYME|nr:Macrophage mannose receptor 1 [Oryzias melastigma]